MQSVYMGEDGAFKVVEEPKSVIRSTNNQNRGSTSRGLRLIVDGIDSQVAGELNIPSSKYHAHRALMLAAMSPGQSVINGLSDAGHVRHTIGSLKSLGIKIKTKKDIFLVEGGEFHPTSQEISVGSSGTTLYFLVGLASLADSPVTIVGQRYFQRRPIRPLLDALTGLGVVLDSPTSCPPIKVQPKRPTGGIVTIPGMLSQWISGLLLLAPFATGPSAIIVDGPFNERSYVDLTIRMMAQFGLHVEVLENGHRFEIEPNQQPVPTAITLPPDVGSAAFGLGLTALHPSDVIFRGLKARSASETDHPEAELLDIVNEMGLAMEVDPATKEVIVRHSGIELKPIDVDCRNVPDMLPILSVLATFANGTSRFNNVAHVRLKESDRVSAMLQLNRMGGNLELRGEQLICRGVKDLHGSDLSSFNDHRVLMSLAIAATRAKGQTRLTYPNAYRISYPRFLNELNGIGTKMSVGSKDNQTLQVPTKSNTTNKSLNVSKVAATKINKFLERWACEKPNDTAIVDYIGDLSSERSWSWEKLGRAVDAFASELIDLKVEPGESVAYLLPNCAEFVALSLAILKIGAICCPVIPIFREREIAFVIRKSKARVFVIPKKFRGRNIEQETLDLLSSTESQGLQLEHVIAIGLPNASPDGDSDQSDNKHHPQVKVTWTSYESSEDLLASHREVNKLVARAHNKAKCDMTAQLLFTSGTSGEPKGVLHQMDTLNRAAAMQINHLGLNAKDRIFIPSPLAHQTGLLYGMWIAVVMGSPQILQSVWDGELGLKVIRKNKATFIQAATPFLADLLAATESSGDKPEELRIFVATGAAVPRGLAEHATRALETSVCGAWGSTETCLGALSSPFDEPAKTWGTDGRPLDGIKLRITDKNGQVLPEGEEGQLEVKSPCLFRGYLDRPDWTAEVLTKDGWYKTGDLAVLDDTGFLRLRGRIKDVINRGGEKIPVGEIEDILYRHPSVKEIAIVAMPDERLGEKACAYVVSSGSFDFQTMQEYLSACKVAKHYWPERLELVQILPRNATGKIQKNKLRELVKEQIEKEQN